MHCGTFNATVLLFFLTLLLSLFMAEMISGCLAKSGSVRDDVTSVCYQPGYFLKSVGLV